MPDPDPLIATLKPFCMAQSTAQSIFPQTLSEGQASRFRGRIMISGNHNDSRYMMHVLLEMWGYEVIEAAGEDETVRLAESEHPELILVDTHTQFEEDLKVVSCLRGSHLLTSIPIIVLSEYPQADYQKAAFEKGATGHLVKPLDLDLLESYLETCL